MISAYAQNTIKTTVEPMVIESLREYKINNFAFDKLRLGSIVSTASTYRSYTLLSQSYKCIWQIFVD
jgi:hypothetical protein